VYSGTSKGLFSPDMCGRSTLNHSSRIASGMEHGRRRLVDATRPIKQTSTVVYLIICETKKLN